MKTTTLFAAFIAAATIANAADEPVKGMNKIPAAAAEGLKRYASDHSMKIEKVSTQKHGKVTVYEAELTAPGQPNHEVAVTADGNVKGEEETVPLEKVPEAARKAIEAGAKGQKIARVQRIQEDGIVTYEAAYQNAKGKITEVEYLEDGKPKPQAP
jgi:hypothetical protein